MTRTGTSISQDVARLDRPFNTRLDCFDARPILEPLAIAGELGKRSVDRFDVEVTRRRQTRARELASQVGHQRAGRAQRCGGLRDDHAPAPQPSRDRNCGEAGAAAADEYGQPGINPLVNGDLLDRADHPLGHEPQHGRGALLEPEAERPLNVLFECPARCLDVELHRPAEEVARVYVAEHQVGVGHGRAGATSSVAGGSRLGPGAVRAHVEQAPGVDPPGTAIRAGRSVDAVATGRSGHPQHIPVKRSFTSPPTTEATSAPPSCARNAGRTDSSAAWMASASGRRGTVSPIVAPSTPRNVLVPLTWLASSAQRALPRRRSPSSWRNSARGSSPCPRA